MKTNTLLVFAALIIFAIASSSILVSAPSIKETRKDAAWEIAVDSIPRNLDEFKAMRDSLASSPQGAMVVYLVAHLILKDNPTLGQQCLIISLDMSQLVKASAGSKFAEVEGWTFGSSEGYKLNMSTFNRSKSYVANSYVKGTSTEQGYKLPGLPYKYTVTKHGYQDADPDVWKGMVRTSCNDQGYVLIQVKKNSRGVWKVFNSSGFYSGCKAPKTDDGDEL